MHGRLKVRTNEEQAEAKRLERLKKQQIYQAATAKAFTKRRAGEFDGDALKISGSILCKNPDVYSLWNYRCEILNHMKTIKTAEEMKSLFDSELLFLEECLKVNPKSYGCWQHRCFCMLNTPEPDWKRELMLCNQFLEYDERNFHCWDYRRFIVKNSDVTADSELHYTTEKIAKNFSNYSSWHYRSKLLAQIYPDKSQSSGVQQQEIMKEFEMVQNAFFTDPSDQSAWFYHRWLLGRKEEQLSLLNAKFASNDNKKITLTFTTSVCLPGNSQLIAVDENEAVSVSWRNPSENQFGSVVWIGTLPESTHSKSLVLNVSTGSKCLSFAINAVSGNQTDKTFKHAEYFKHALNASTNEVLVKEFESCEQLFELEPDNKWVLLTIVLLMKVLDSVKYQQNISDKLGQIAIVDPYRKNYYRDLRSRFTVENSIASLSAECEIFYLSGKNLSRLYHTNLLFHIKILDISNNELVSLEGVNIMQALEVVKAAGNSIVDCEGVKNMPNLHTLNLSNNKIISMDGFKPLLTCPLLMEVQLIGNPVGISHWKASDLA